jgi:4-hydroxybenzoate polyprenyltransferase
MAINEPARTSGDTRLTTAVQKAAFVVGAAFLLVGILGFIPGITTDYDTMTFAGHESGARLLGIFEVSILHNIVHLAFGLAGLLLARTFAGARSFLIGAGAIYLVLWVYGLLIDHEKPANFVPVNDADNWLHFGLGAAMVLLGVLLSRQDTATRVPVNRTPPDDRQTG